MKKYFYIVITKCACQTVFHLYRNDKNFIDPVFGPIKYYRSPNHESLMKKQDRKLEYFDFSNEDIITFSFIRNPYDRAVSSWKYAQREKWTKLDFLPFLKNLPKILDSNPEDLNGVDHLIKRHTAPQWEWLISNQNEYAADFIGRVENLGNHVKLLDQYLGLPKTSRNIPRINHSRPIGDNYSQHYSPEIREIVEIIYQKDIEKFGYKFGKEDPKDIHYKKQRRD